MPCEYIIFPSPLHTTDKEQSIAEDIETISERVESRAKEENLVFMAVMSMKIYVQQIRRFISIDGYYVHFFNIPL
jgi:hypothetical protein